MVQSQSYRRALMRLATVGLFLFALLVSGLGPAAPAAALTVNPAVVISQIYGGGGNTGAPLTNDYVELFNRSAAPVNLSGMSIQYASATGTGNLGANSSQLVVLPASMLQPGQYFLVQLGGGATGAPLPTPDVTGTIAAAAGAGKFALVNSTSGLGCNGGSTPCTDAQTALIIDLVGYGSANFFEGNAAAPTLSNTTAGFRADNGCTDTNNNGTDFSTGTPAPRNSAAPLNSCGGGSTPTPSPTPEPVDPCTLAFTPIYNIQGSGDSAAITGAVTTQGVVVGDFQGGASALGGFYLQDALGDGDPATSDGIFVFNRGNPVNVQLGQLVRVSGNAAEFQAQTQISNVTNLVDCGVGPALAPVDVTMPFPAPLDGVPYLERYEGMLVRFPQTLSVTEHFQLGRFGQIVMSSGDRLYQPTNVFEPGPAASALQAANDLNRIIVDDALNNQNPDPILFGRGGDPLSASNTLRGGDTATSMVGVMTFGWAGNAASPNNYRLRPVGALGGGVPNFQPSNPRPAEAPAVGGSLKIASFNVLNYFLTLDYPSSDPRDNKCGPLQNVECRGADSLLELERQRTKLLQALLEIDADILGLIEIENTPGVSPEGDLAAALNTALGAEIYAALNTGVIGTDAIRVGFIYKQTKVTPVGDFALLDATVDPRFDSSRSRPALAQSFIEHESGGVLTVVNNHFKSKGDSGLAATCTTNGPAFDPNCDQGDGQGFWNATRTNAALAMMEWLQSDPTGSGDRDFLIIGDLNAYAKEDPIAVIEEFGFVNLSARFGGEKAYSYVFDGQWGYLDHALASPSLNAQVTGAAKYHINADEPSVLDYNVEFKSASQVASLFAPDAFRTSDHDPVLVGTALNSDLYRAIQQGQQVRIERNVARAGLGDWDANGDGWALLGRTNGARNDGELRGFFVTGGVPYAIVFNRSPGADERCILVSPESLDLVGQPQNRLLRTVNDNYLPCPTTSYAQLP